MGKDSKRHQKKKMPEYKEGEEMGYHSEAAKVQEYKEGEEMGYHSEAAKVQEYKEGEGRKVGYHSEAANPSTHRARLHTSEQEGTEAAEEDRDKGPT
jgi:hypothetical protein